MYISTQSFKTFKIEKFSFSSFYLLMLFSNIPCFFQNLFFTSFYLLAFFQYWKNSLFPHITFWCFFSILFNKISSNYHLFLLIDLHLFSSKKLMSSNVCHYNEVLHTNTWYLRPNHDIYLPHFLKWYIFFCLFNVVENG